MGMRAGVTVIPCPCSSARRCRRCWRIAAGPLASGTPASAGPESFQGPTLRQALGAAADPLVSPLQLKVLERGASGRVLALQISGSSDARSGPSSSWDAIRRTLRTLPSTLFVLEPQGTERWWVVGGGFGPWGWFVAGWSH